MIMENENSSNYMQMLQQNYLLYIVFVSIIMNKIFQNIENVHITSNYEVVETDTAREYVQKLVDEIIENAIEKCSEYENENFDDTPVINDVSYNVPVPDVTYVAKQATFWQYIKTYKPFAYIV